MTKLFSLIALFCSIGVQASPLAEDGFKRYEFTVKGDICISPNGRVCYESQPFTANVQFEMAGQMSDKNIHEIRSVEYTVELKQTPKFGAITLIQSALPAYPAQALMEESVGVYPEGFLFQIQGRSKFRNEEAQGSILRHLLVHQIVGANFLPYVRFIISCDDPEYSQCHLLSDRASGVGNVNFNFFGDVAYLMKFHMNQADQPFPIRPLRP